jgi:type IV pilus assembly protein PilW
MSANRRPPRRPHGPRGQRGVSIVELMVGVVVAMLVGIAAAGSAMMFTAAQRQGVGVGGVGISAASALAALKNDAASAGLGFFGDATYLCAKLALSVGATLHSDGADFAPLRITSDDDGDVIDIVYGDRVESGANVRLNAASDGTSAELMSLLPAAVGQAVMLAPAPGSGGDTCLVRSVTAVTASTDDTPQLLAFADTGQHNKASFGTEPAFDADDRVTLLGELNWNRYRRVGQALMLDRPLTGDSVVLARNVLALRAQYGIAAAGGTTLDEWTDAVDDFESLDAATLPRVRAIRLGIVTRSPQREKPDADGNCEASLAKPQLFGTEVEPDVDDWQCYRYRVSTAVVPMRNIVLGLK